MVAEKTVESLAKTRALRTGGGDVERSLIDGVRRGGVDELAEDGAVRNDAEEIVAGRVQRQVPRVAQHRVPRERVVDVLRKGHLLLQCVGVQGTDTRKRGLEPARSGAEGCWTRPYCNPVPRPAAHLCEERVLPHRAVRFDNSPGCRPRHLARQDAFRHSAARNVPLR
jgi:hypothetical protein